MFAVLAVFSAGSAHAQEKWASDAWLEQPVEAATFETYLDFFAYDAEVPFDLEVVKEQIASLNPGGEILVLSSLKGDGIDDWIGLLHSRLEAKRRA